MRSCFQILILLILTLQVQKLDAQQNDKKKLFDLSGYIKNLQIIQFGGGSDPLFDNMIHNRTHFYLYPFSKLTFRMDFRNRIFFGDSPKIPFFVETLSYDPGFLDLTRLVVEGDSWFYIAQLDRLWIDWTDKNWSARLGRQRINWGINLYWNSNDLFNAYNLSNFDYEELPGADAFRFQAHFKEMRSIEFALQPARDSRNWVAALLYKFNTGGYDFQVLGGWWNEDIVIGSGWAGNIKNAGFKGEISYFYPRQADGTDVLSLSVSADYFFKNSLYFTSGFLFNSNGITEPLEQKINLFAINPSAKNLMPTKYNLLLNISYPVTPLISVSALAIYAPGTELIYIIPNFNYSISNSWELGLFVQTFWIQTTEVENITNSGIIRFKFNY